MTFMHKLSCRLALLKDALPLVAAVLLASCEMRRNVAGVDAELRVLQLSPTNVALQPSQMVDFTVVGLDQNGDTVDFAVLWSVTSGTMVDTGTSGRRHYGRYKAGSDTGRVKVIAKGRSSPTADTATVVVALPSVASVSINPPAATIQTGASTQLVATVRDSAGNQLAGRSVSWSSGAAGVATVNSTGLVTGIAAGSATITATSEGKSGTAAITVTTIPVASVTVSPAQASVDTGKTVQLTAAPKDANGNALAGRVITWASSNPVVATVSGTGLVRGVSAGSATITATSEGRSGTSVVTVKVSAPAPVASVTVTPAAASLPVGSGVQLVAVARDSGGTILQGRLMSWRSGDSLIAKVTAVGLVTAIATGGTFVIASSEGRSDTAQITVTVLPPPDSTLGVALPPLLAPSTGSAYYVATTGSDANPGTITQPWRTIQKAMDALQPGQKAFVRAGTYETGGTFGTSDDSQFWSKNCTALGPCSILAYPGERPVIHGWIKITGSYLRLSGFIIEGPLSRDETSCSERRAMQIEFSGGHHVEISNNEIRNNDYHAGIYLSGVNNVHLIGNYIHDNGRFTIDNDPCTGSSVWNVDHGVYWSRNSGGGNLVANNLFVHNRGYGVQFYPSAADVLVIQNTFVENGNAGVLTYETADRITIINNVSAFNERSKQIKLVSGNANVVRRNVIFSPVSSLNGIENGTSSVVTDNVIADPRFVDRAGRNFRLLTGSPAIDWALRQYSALIDYLNQVRPRGAAPDAGAIEY